MDQNEFFCRGFIPGPVSQAPAAPGADWARPRDLSWPDPVLAQAFRRSRGAFLRREEAGGFRLAYPLDCRAPFPLPPLFCFARAECLGGRGWWVFAFGGEGAPRFPGA